MTHNHRTGDGMIWEYEGTAAFLDHMLKHHPDFPAVGDAEGRRHHRSIHALMDAGQWPHRLVEHPRPTSHEQVLAALKARRDEAQAALDRAVRAPLFPPMPNPLAEPLRKHFQQILDLIPTHDLVVESGWDEAGNWKVTLHATPRKEGHTRD